MKHNQVSSSIIKHHQASSNVINRHHTLRQLYSTTAVQLNSCTAQQLYSMAAVQYNNCTLWQLYITVISPGGWLGSSSSKLRTMLIRAYNLRRKSPSRHSFNTFECHLVSNIVIKSYYRRVSCCQIICWNPGGRYRKLQWGVAVGQAAFPLSCVICGIMQIFKNNEKGACRKNPFNKKFIFWAKGKN